MERSKEALRWLDIINGDGGAQFNVERMAWARKRPIKHQGSSSIIRRCSKSKELENALLDWSGRWRNCSSAENTILSNYQNPVMHCWNRFRGLLNDALRHKVTRESEDKSHRAQSWHEDVTRVHALELQGAQRWSESYKRNQDLVLAKMEMACKKETKGLGGEDFTAEMSQWEPPSPRPKRGEVRRTRVWRGFNWGRWRHWRRC